MSFTLLPRRLCCLSTRTRIFLHTDLTIGKQRYSGVCRTGMCWKVLCSNKILKFTVFKSVCSKYANDKPAGNRKNKLGLSMLYDVIDGQDQYLANDDWMKIKSVWDEDNRVKIKVGGAVFVEKAMALLCSKTNWEMTQSLMDFADQNCVQRTQSFMNNYLYTCVVLERRKEILVVYGWFKEHSSILSVAVLKNLISGLCLTDHWKESLKLLEVAKSTAQLPSRGFNSVICAACLHKEYDLVEDLVEQLISLDMNLRDETIVTLLKTYDGIAENPGWAVRCKNMVVKLLTLFRTKRILPSIEVAKTLQDWFNRITFEQWESRILTIDNKQNCPQCNTPMEKLALTDKEFQNLHDQVIQKVIHGSDIFRKTSPRELEAFIKFVDYGGPYDVIIDGLNVALVQFNKTRQPSNLLLLVVQHLVNTCHYKCLVLGRCYMVKRWNKQDMHKIMDCADCFFTEDISEDDPFMLYATLQSGPRAMYVTRDMFRDHKALLDHDTNIAFVKWQRGHQLSFINFKKGIPHFKSCRYEDTVTQTTGDSWHVPVCDEKQNFAYQLPTTWLCCRRKSNKQQ